MSALKCVTYEDRLQELGLPTLEEQRHQAAMCMVHKIMPGKGKILGLSRKEAGRVQRG